MDDNNLVLEQELGPITVNQFGERFFYNLSRHNFDRVSAQALFERKFAEVLFKEDALFVIVGSDSGLLLHYLQSKPLPKGSRYLIVEPEGVLQALQAHGMLGEINERIVCVNPDQWVQALHDFKLTDYSYIGAVSSLNAFCAEDDFINQYAELSWHVAEVLSQLHWRYSMELGSEAFMTRQINNVVDNRFPAKLLERCFLDKTAIILAGGPSLDEALSWVKLHRHKLVVLAVSRISRQLLAAGIEPDFVFSVDPTELSFDISKEMLKFGPQTCFVCSYHTVPTLLNQWLGPVFYLGARLPWQSVLNVTNLGSAGPTVTNTAISIAYDFGFRRLILAGVDLCFTREGFTHATGSDEQLAGPRFNLTSLQVETNGGFWAPTSCDFAQAIDSLRLQAKALGKFGCRLINVSPGAAKVDDIEFIPLDAIELESVEINVPAIVKARLDSSRHQQGYLAKLEDELKRAHYQLNAIAKLAAEARQINDAMYVGDNHTIVSFKGKRDLDQIEKKLKKDHRQFSKLVKRFGIRSLIKLAKPFSDQEWTVEEARQLGNTYYDTYLEGANKLLALIADAQQRLRARQQEQQDDVDFALLLAQNRKDRSFARVNLWRQQWPEATLTPAIVAEFRDFEQQFEQVLRDTNTRHFARAKQHSHLPSVRQRAGLLFKHKKREELGDLLKALDKYEQQHETLPYRYLIAGYLAELQEDYSSALQAYHQIVDTGDKLLEEALSRIAAISLENDDAAIAAMALQCLAQLNPYFLPLYAELQRLQGDIMAAIDSYNGYIAQFPEDMLAQMKLAMLYCESGVDDAADLMVNSILQRQPGHAPALALKQQLANRRALGVASR